MRRVSGDINAAHPRLDEVIMSLSLIGDRHDMSEGIIIKSATFDAVKDGQNEWLVHRTNPTYKLPKSM